jgi:putative membrane protein
MRLSKVLFLGAVGVLLAAAQSQPGKGTASRAAMGQADSRFIEQAAKGGHNEVEFGRMGVEKATNPEVKAFAQRLVDDHTKANQELMELAKQKNVTLPTTYPKDTALDHLSKLSGAAFDKEFVRMAIADHQKDIALFERQATSGTDPDVKAWANKTLPTLRAHLDQAKAIKL